MTGIRASSIITCSECKQVRKHEAHGLCSACAQRARRIKKGIRVRCGMPGCPAFSALPTLLLCKGHITDELAGLGADEFEARIAEMFAGQFAVVGECWEFSGTIHCGYGRITLKTDGVRQRIFMHHLVVQLRVGRPLQDFALHHCDNRPCFRPSHLYEGSYAENAADAVARDRTAWGLRSARAKLSPEEVCEILARYQPGRSQWDRGNGAQLAREFGVTRAYIAFIARRGHWSLRRSA